MWEVMLQSWLNLLAEIAEKIDLKREKKDTSFIGLFLPVNIYVIAMAYKISDYFLL